MAGRDGPPNDDHQIPAMPGDPTDPRGMAALAARYFDWMAVTNYSPATITNRAYSLTHFIDWCRARDVTRPNEVTRPIVERFQRWLHHQRRKDGRSLSFRTQYLRLGAVKGFFKWLAKKNFVLYNPAGEMDMPRLGNRLPRGVPSAAEVETILNQADITDALGLRDRAIMETFYSTGIRRKELIGLEIYDIDEGRGTVLVRQGKGRKDRVVPIGERALAWVRKYVHGVRPGLLVASDVATLTVRGTAFSTSRLTERIGAYVRASGVRKTGACHLFRHAMATHMLENGADIRYIQEILGHAQITTTEVYTSVTIQKMKEVHAATHPARLRKRRPSARSQQKPEPDPEEELLSLLEGESKDL